MNNTKIDWATASWNPITGCLHGCQYCYAMGIAKRFGKSKDATRELDKLFAEEFNEPVPGKLHELDNPVYYSGKIDPYPYEFDPTFHRYHLDKPQHWKKPRNIFVVSMGDMFGEWVPLSWIKEVFDACEAAPWHNYIFLTKNPQRYNDLFGDRLLPTANNFWYGGTRTGVDSDREHEAAMSGHTFLSVEPLLAPMEPAMLNAIECWDWVIIGAESGNRKDKAIPKREWVADIVDTCRAEGVPVFLKSSLAGIWGEPLIQEYPRELAVNVDKSLEADDGQTGK